jgi:DNA-binding FadR family transcriptional regulator
MNKTQSISRGKAAPQTRIRRRRLYEDVAEQLETRISEGLYRSGTELPSERVLMQEFGVGRPAIREALFALQKMGLLHLSPGERPRVQEPARDVIIDSMRGAVNRFMAQPGGLRQFQRARIFFEVGIVREAARHATTADLDRIQAALTENRASLGSPRRFEETDVAFHFTLATTAHNSLFLVIHDAMFEWLYSQRTVTLAVTGQPLFALQAHEKISEAIVAGDADAAEAAMRAHLEHGHKLYWDIIEPGGAGETEAEAEVGQEEASRMLGSVFGRSKG